MKTAGLLLLLSLSPVAAAQTLPQPKVGTDAARETFANQLQALGWRERKQSNEIAGIAFLVIIVLAGCVFGILINNALDNRLKEIAAHETQQGQWPRQLRIIIIILVVLAAVPLAVLAIEFFDVVVAFGR